jgi:hypothetical protein
LFHFSFWFLFLFLIYTCFVSLCSFCFVSCFCFVVFDGCIQLNVWQFCVFLRRFCNKTFCALELYFALSFLPDDEKWVNFILACKCLH